RFKADPGRYVGEDAHAHAGHGAAATSTSTPPATPGAAVEYTCPMHPEIVRSGPGSCPICGMALEPRTVAEVEDDPELRDMTRRFRVSLALTLPVFALAMSEMLPGQPLQRAFGERAIAWLQL